MLNCRDFYTLLQEKGFAFFTGVPDSLLKDFCAFVMDNTPADLHIIAANEGNALALSAGRYLATGKPGVVYMQNSGLGNIVNPLASLTDPLVYSIPALLIIGWRGEPGVKDEPQHAKQGQITLELLKTLGVEYAVLPSSHTGAAAMVEKAAAYMKETSSPFALIVSKGTFEPYLLQKETGADYELSREEAIGIVADGLASSDIVVSTTGMASRELFEYRAGHKKSHHQDFLTVGSMGHASQIALGIALAKPHRQIYCLDGDGALLMHTGGLAVIGQQAPVNFKHIIFNNGAHDSVGGQPTAAFNVDIPALAKACGYREVMMAQTRDDVGEKIRGLKLSPGPSLLEIRVRKGARKELGRPTSSPVENKVEFMKFIAEQ